LKFGFCAKHRGTWPVALMCEALDVSRSGFYAWLTRPRSLRSIVDEVLGIQVRQSFVGSDRTYGARRVWHDVLAVGHECGLHRVERLMWAQGLRARPRRRGLPVDRGARSAIADNVLDRQFQADAPNQKWVADFTYIWTAEGWLYAAAVLDLYSRRIVGWSMHDSMTSQLVADALMMAVWRRGKPVQLLHHSDQGSQYTSEHFQALLREQGITCSMSRAGEVWDNSAMESFFSSLKTEKISRKVYRTRTQARADVFDYIEGFYNPVPPLAEQSRIVTRVEELMRLCDALEAKGQLEAAQHAQLVQTLLGTLTDSTSPEELADNWQRLATHFDLLLDRPEAIDALEQTILQLAVRGLLVPQDPADEPASELLKKIRSEKDRLIAAGKIKRDKPLPPIEDDEKPFELPAGWEWTAVHGVHQVVSERSEWY
jgi:putative transposase